MFLGAQVELLGAKIIFDNPLLIIHRRGLTPQAAMEN